MSVQPPASPASSPTGTPITSATSTETTPASIEARAPYSTRDSTSRPFSSVPNQCAAEGALRIAVQEVASGSDGASQRRGDGGGDEQHDHQQPEDRQPVPQEAGEGAAERRFAAHRRRGQGVALMPSAAAG